MPTTLKTSKIALHKGGISAVVVLVIFCVQCGSNPPGPVQSINEGDHIVLIGNNFMLTHDEFRAL